MRHTLSSSSFILDTTVAVHANRRMTNEGESGCDCAIDATCKFVARSANNNIIDENEIHFRTTFKAKCV